MKSSHHLITTETNIKYVEKANEMHDKVQHSINKVLTKLAITIKELRS